MKLIIGFLLLATTQVCKAQYYYKDLIATQENSTRWKLYKDNHVQSVKLNSFMGDKPDTAAGFEGDQQVSSDFLRITTHTKSASTPDSWIIAVYNPQGQTLKITDTSDTYRSISDYQYNPQGHITAILNTATETDNHLKETEQHIWTYDPANPDRPMSMLKIKNNTDTTFVRFTTDDKGNIAEEHAIRNKEELPVIYYYYDDNHRLTDIVRYNVKAQRLLPDNVFEYDEKSRLTSSLIVPQGNSDYQKWYYVYNDDGLKIKDFCYNKYKELVGSVEYEYSFK